MRKLLCLFLLVLISCSSISVEPDDLRTDPVADHRRRAAVMIGEDQDGQYLPTLLEALHSDDVDIVRAQAAISIGELGVKRPQVYAQLTDSLKNDPSPLVQQDVITALNKLEYNKAVPVLIEKLRTSPHPDVRAASVSVLEKIGTTEAITALKEARDDESVKVRFAAKNALKNLRDTPAFAQLTPEQQSETAEERTTWWMVR